MITKSIGIEDFIATHLCFEPNDSEDLSCSIFRVNTCQQLIDAVKLNFHLVILCNKGKCNVFVGHHDFTIESFTISIVPPHTLFSIKHFSKDFDAYFLLFKSDFIKKRICKK